MTSNETYSFFVSSKCMLLDTKACGVLDKRLKLGWLHVNSVTISAKFEKKLREVIRDFGNDVSVLILGQFIKRVKGS